MEYKLEITRRLEDLAESGSLDRSIAILNLPSANYCEKRAEKVYIDGKLQQACLGCVTQDIKSKESLGIAKVRQIIDFFANEYGTRLMTINGRGDPFHPKLKEDNLEKIVYANKEHGIKSYVFTAGNNLDERTCKTLADNGANVMISLFGNRFIDAEFFSGKEYLSTPRPLQDQAGIAKNLRLLISTYKSSSNKPEDKATRIGMNYVVSEIDLADNGAKLQALKKAANENNIFFVCNTNFSKHSDENMQLLLEQMANQYSDFNLKHSTSVSGRCQMGAGSSATVDYDGTLLRCPYMDTAQGDGKFQELSVGGIKNVLEKYKQDRQYSCVMRKHEK